MADRPLADRLDDTIDAVIARGDATAALADAELAPLARIAADLRHYPSPEFKARLRAQLERRTIMTALATPTAVRQGFSTVTPYIRTRDAGLVDFLARVFDARETLSRDALGGGRHREVRVGDSMVIIAEGGTLDVVPARPMAFHVFVEDADATFARALAAGATSLGEPANRPYGERSGFVVDPLGNHWYIATALGPESVASALGTVTPFLHAKNARDYVDFLKRALGAVEEARHEQGVHFRYARLRVGDGAIEFGEGEPMPGSFLIHVAEPEAHYARALEAGARSIMPVADLPYGRLGGVEDAVGNQWYFARP